MKKIILPLIIILITGCAINRSTAIPPTKDLSNVKNFYIVEEPSDKGTNNVYEILKINLEKRGYKVSTGNKTIPDYKPSVIVTYVDSWMWDMSMYMIELTITFIDPATNLPITRGNSFHTSLTRLSPEEMVNEVLTNIFNAKSN